MPKDLVILAYPKIDHEKNYVYFWMPFSVLTVAKAITDETGLEVIIFDGNQKGELEWASLLREKADRLLFVGLSLMTGGGQIGHAIHLMEIVKKISDVPIVVGGPHVNVLSQQTAEHNLVDYALTGPGQTSAPKFAQFIMGAISYAEVPGLVSIKNGEAHFGSPNAPRSRDLGNYPWSLIDVEYYIRDDPTVASRTLNYVSSQGCVYKCRFCYETTYKRKWSSQPAEALLEDIGQMVDRFGVNGIKFYDADWFINLNRARDFCEGLLASGLKISWAASINPNDVQKARTKQPGLLGAMAKSGCTRLLMGIESGSERVLRDVVKKEISREQIFSVAQEIARHGIMGSYTFIVGFPGESEAEVEETYEFLDQLRGLDPRPETRVHLFAPYPGTPLFDEAMKAGFSPPSSLEGWSNYDYYESQTPWTSPAIAMRARHNTHMILSPTQGG